MIILLSAATYSFPEQVARRCKGEASSLLPQCSCVVLNRVNHGWSKATVLNQFYAPDKPVTTAEVKSVEDVLTGVAPCNKDFYFMFSLQDVIKLKLQNVEPVAKFVLGKNSEIWMLEYWYSKRKSK